MTRVLIFFLVMLTVAIPVSATSVSIQKQLLFSSHDTAVNWICSKSLIEAYQQLGIKIHIDNFPSKRSLSMSNSGQTDGEVCRVKGTY